MQWLHDHQPEVRIQHTLRVEEMAIALANHHGLDVDQAAQAGLMHDLAKYFKPKQLLAMMQSEGHEFDPVEVANPHLLHADVSAIVARDTFEICDRTILTAIRNHTLGSPGMDALSCVVFLADSLEPGRGDTDDLNTLRQTSYDNLYQGVYATCNYTLKSLLDHQRPIHPRAILTRNWFLQASRAQSKLNSANACLSA